jgi:SynChlorMet cassette radical SAM/SPASM protein ScmF
LDNKEIPPLSTIYFYLTESCNLQCAHCWLSKKASTVEEDVLTFSEIEDVLVQAQPLGLRSIKLTGGEPFLRSDIVDILMAAQELGVTARIESNGTLISEAVARSLGDLDNLTLVAVSLDGATAESHAQLRGAAASFAAAIRGIRHLVEQGVNVQVIAAIHRGNAGEVGAIADLAADLGARSLKLNPVTAIGRGLDMEERGELLELDEVLALAREVELGRYDVPGLSIHLALPAAFLGLDAIRRQGLNNCGVMDLLGVLPDGSLSICGIGEEDKHLVFGHVRQTGIETVWTGSPELEAIRREIRRWPTGICVRCLVRKYCIWGYCRAEAYARYGSLSAPAPFCQECYEAELFPASRLL